MADIIQIPEERGFSLSDLGNSVVGIIQERIEKADRQFKQCVNDFLKSVEEIEADFVSTTLIVRPVQVEKIDRFPFSTSDNLDGYINIGNSGSLSEFMEENY